MVRAVGGTGLALALTQLGSIAFRGRMVRVIALAAIAILAANVFAMTLFYTVRLFPGLAATNVALLLMAAGILFGYRTSPVSSGRG